MVEIKFIIQIKSNLFKMVLKQIQHIILLNLLLMMLI